MALRGGFRKGSGSHSAKQGATQPTRLAAGTGAVADITAHLNTRKASSNLSRSLRRSRWWSRRRTALHHITSLRSPWSDFGFRITQGTEDSDTAKCSKPIAQTSGSCKLLAVEPKLGPTAVKQAGHVSGATVRVSAYRSGVGLSLG